MDHTINEFLRKKKFEAYNKPGLQSGNRSLGKKMNKRLFFLFSFSFPPSFPMWGLAGAEDIARMLLEGIFFLENVFLNRGVKTRPVCKSE